MPPSHHRPPDDAMRQNGRVFRCLLRCGNRIATLGNPAGMAAVMCAGPRREVNPRLTTIARDPS